jgi:RNA polymerase sigma factor (TIGR02999 family)
VNELYVKLFGAEPVAWQNRAHFFAVAARQIRRLLIDYARAHNARKREGGSTRLSLTEAGDLAATPQAHDLIEIDEALTRLQTLDARAASVVELRFFGGLTETESAEALGISLATLKRDWDFARAWLSTQLTG